MDPKENLKKIGETLLSEGTIYGKNVLSAEDCKTLYTKAFALYSAHAFSEAEELFERLVQAQPFYIDHWMGYGATLQMQKNYEKALRSWALAALIEESNPLPHFHAAECLFSLGQNEEGLLALQRAHLHAKQSSPDLCAQIEGLLSLKEPKS